MARIYKRGKYWWYQWQGERVSTRCTDQKAAALVFADVQRRSADPTHAASDEARLADWSKRMLAAKDANKAEGTAAMYRVKIGHVLRVFGEDARLSEVTPESVDHYVTTRQEEEASNNTIGKELTALLQTLKLAKRAGAYRGDLSVLKPPDFSIDYKPRERVLSAADEKKLRAVCSPAQWGAIALILGSACRLSEAERVQAGDIDWKRRELRIRGTKTDASDAVIPIVDRCGMADRLREAEPHLPIQWELYRSMSRGLPVLCKAAGIPALTPNDLRRTVATRLVESGVDAYTVSKITRHVTLGMLKRVYDRTSVAATRELIDGPARRRASRSGGTAKVQRARKGTRSRRAAA